MNNNQLLLRHAILLQLEAAYPGSLPIETVRQGVCVAGFKLDQCVLIKELHYLIEKKMITTRQNTLSPSATRYSLTADGRDYLDSQGLVAAF
ncbi:MAG: hypothetical protein COZ46_07575 [Verrucomicrobia bacterium CG_4_10_14_3_um_filter_43_23]|nr:MAG: hypothetical protein AUJ82_03220 [Verrucomicrobia bacterium CG1_02_43_26]PIP59706.1 MAG: hypothetical protein COX01_02050 [Verrucomicrobia bacterium CG22_combo_CG10-13_8_21_14_all_43_17]PIX57718.1 MAG: hypothetical protein COZ46_07575 [Verrucomicrobia bacterium CG_4_10_14_3_um_filter_43_23]PIY62510.1 MAG: hypothetical protein COY94_01760 [Verrucomicrobia bacterium CG_4_10_14_0_8_um_filter_43_34]PJA44670.1 MAG: hypothetical protein CO175_01865 [Verrucomicrobia bacterium CG_4_9_14_3_um_fi